MTISENTIVIPVNDATYGIMNVAITIRGTEKINWYYSERTLKSGMNAQQWQLNIGEQQYHPPMGKQIL